MEKVGGKENKEDEEEEDGNDGKYEEEVVEEEDKHVEKVVVEEEDEHVEKVDVIEKMHLRTPPKNKTSSAKVHVSAYRDGGFKAKRNYTKFEEIFMDLCDTMEEYACGDHDYVKVTDILEYGVWTPIGEHVDYSHAKNSTGTTRIIAFDLSVALFYPWAYDLADLSNRITNKSKKEWLKVTQSTIKGAGAGLFAGRSFGIGEIISVYCGELQKDKPSVFSIEIRGHIIDAMGANEDIPLYWGAHLVNDVNWYKEGDTPKTTGRHRHKNNAEFHGLYLKATSVIKPNQEIFVSYNFS